MQAYVFVEDDDQVQAEALRTMAHQVLQKVAQGTSTDRLVVAIYFLEDSSVWRGELASTKPVGPAAFATNGRRRWSFTERFPAPADLPESFGLIRVALGSRWRSQMTMLDDYGHRLRFGRFEDHLAFMFAHELHHYRRHHLGLHPGEGEVSADQWAVQHVTGLGYEARITSVRRRRRRRNGAKAARIRIPVGRNAPLLQRIKARAAKLCMEDLRDLSHWIQDRIQQIEQAARQDEWEKHYQLLRSLPEGAKLQVVRDNPGSHSRIGQVMTKIRTLTRGSERMAVREQSGRVWHWPMRWLKPVEEQPL